MSKKIAVIIGGGPAGLTAAYELLKRTNIKPVVFDLNDVVGGLSRTEIYKGNRIDIGGHRFFSKSDRVNKWWLNILPLQGSPSKDDLILDRKVVLSDKKDAPDPEETDSVMLQRRRLSRIFFLRKFFDYPISLSFKTLRNLGLVRVFRIGVSYIWIRVFPVREEKNLENFFINRFGRELYKTFFKDYTEKVWGVPCSQIKSEWGAERIKGLSVTKAIIHATRSIFYKDKTIFQKGVENTLISQFMYPKLGPGQVWGKVAEEVEEMGGDIFLKHRVIELKLSNEKIISVTIENLETGETDTIQSDYVFSTMPISELITSMHGNKHLDVERVAEGLEYRDFITVGVLLNKLKISNKTKTPSVNNIIPDNWVYVQEIGVSVGRVQIFNNWSPYMVNDPNTVWIGMEYFCKEGDKLWRMKNKAFKELAISELIEIGMVDRKDVMDSVVIKVPKAYPAYFGTYDEIGVIKEFTDKIDNLFLIGRNGMHRYNNQDHSMLSAMVAVDNIVNNVYSKNNIWNARVGSNYDEEKSI